MVARKPARETLPDDLGEVVARLALAPAGNLYFTQPQESIEYIPTGCTLLDCVLGGGWARRRTINIKGNYATGKTLLAIEACYHFAKKYPSGRIDYVEVESAFDKGYAAALGLPIDRVRFVNDETAIFTVEDLFKWLKSELQQDEKKEHPKPRLVVVDSLDALSDSAEMGRDIDKGTFGTGKAKQMSSLFRQLNSRLAKSGGTIIFVSQIRNKIGMVFGSPTTRSGGIALDFYCSQVVELNKIKTLIDEKHGIERSIGILVRAKCEKNKAGTPLRRCTFPIIYGYGIDDFTANIQWLYEEGRLHSSRCLADVGLTPKPKEDEKKMVARLSYPETDPDRDLMQRVREAVPRLWSEIEVDFLPKRRKYED